MRITIAHLLIVLVIGVFFTFVGFRSGIWMGSSWYKDKATSPWGMNTYFWINAKDAYVFFGLIPMWLGGLCAGITIPLIFAQKPKTSMIPFFLSIFLTGIGFNTLDWMLSGVILSEHGWEAWAMHLDVYLEAWNFYIFMTIIPLFIGGLLIALPLAYFAIYGD